MGEVVVRACRVEDMTAVTAIYRHAVLHGTGSFELDPPEEAEMAARRERITASGYPYLVAVEGSEVLGYAYLAAYRERPAYRFTVEDSIYVRQDCQGRRIGLLLLQRLIELAEAGPYRQMVAVVGDSDNVASIRLHARTGFSHLGVLRSCGWKNDRWLDVVLMQRALGAGDGTPPG